MSRLFPQPLLDCIGSGVEPDATQIETLARHIRTDVEQPQFTQDTQVPAGRTNSPQWRKLAEVALRGQ